MGFCVRVMTSSRSLTETMCGSWSERADVRWVHWHGFMLVIHGLIIYFRSVVCDCIQVNMIALLLIALSLLSERS